MRRRNFMALSGAAALAPILPGRAQSARVYRIGILETQSADRNAANLAALLRGLREYGYIEGRNLQIEYRSVEGQADRDEASEQAVAMVAPSSRPFCCSPHRRSLHAGPRNARGLPDQGGSGCLSGAPEA